MSVKVVTGPTVWPIDLDETRAFLHLDSSVFDGQLELLIAAETRYAEVFTGRRFVPQTWDFYLDSFPAEGETQIIRLPLPRVIGVSAVYYQDASGNEQTLDDDLYVVDTVSEPARIGLAANASWPTTQGTINSVRVRMTVGDQDASSSPATTAVREDVKLAILLRVQAAFEGGDHASGLRDAADSYLKKHRVELSLG